MANLLSRLTRSEPVPVPERRSSSPLAFDQWLTYFTWNGSAYAVGSEQAANLQGMVRQVQSKHGTVAAAVYARQLVLSQVRFVYRSVARGADYGRLFGGANLARLERPAPGMTRPTFIKTLEAHVSFAGNAYAHALQQGGTEILRPDLVDLVYARVDESDDPAGADLVGYRYWRRGRRQGEVPEVVLPDRVAHWRPEPDPLNPHKGLSWVTSVLREIVADGEATDHITRFFENAATPNAIIRPDRALAAHEIEAFQELFEKSYAGVSNAYKTWFIGGGSDVTVVGSKLGELALRDVQGGFETRIASRSRVPATVLGIREGMGGSALNAGNYTATRRMWADGWFSPTVQDLCAALEKIAPPPAGGPAELWYDPSEVLFLQEDQKDAAEISQVEAIAIRQLVEAGFDPDAAVDAVVTKDPSKLRGNHTGLSSVQLQAPATGDSGARSSDAVAELRAQVAALDAARRTAAPDMHLHLPESIIGQVELRQEPVVVPAPVVNVPAPVVNVTVEPTPLAVDVAAPVVNVEAPAVTVNVPETPVQLTLDVSQPGRKSVEFVRDRQGRITGAEMVEQES